MEKGPKEQNPEDKIVNAEEARKDSQFPLRYMGYFLAGLDDERNDLTLADLVQIAKFKICEERGILMNDPVWDRYKTDQEILVEYYAIMYYRNEKARARFEAILAGYDEDDLTWLDDQIKKNRSVVDERKKEQELIDKSFDSGLDEGDE
jgi:hypothetical protein